MFVVVISILIALFFFALAIVSTNLYFSWKARDDEWKRISIDYTPWSFKGFWYRHKSSIALFAIFLFALLSLSFIFILI